MTKIAFVLQEPTPYRTPQLDRVAALPDLDLTIVYAARTIQRRTWETPSDDVVYLRGPVLPLARLLHHDYALTPGIWPLLSRVGPELVVIAGWSVMATQLAILWCRVHRVPYLLMADNTLVDARPHWVRLLKRVVLRWIVPQAAGTLVPGTLAAEHVRHYGARVDRIARFPLTVDIGAFGTQVDAARERREELRSSLGVGADETLVLHVGRLIAQKGVDVLVRAAAAADVPLHVVGGGPEHVRLTELAAEVGARVTFAGEVANEDLAAAYAAADVFALVSHRETWGVVVNEAAASGLPLVLSDRVGAARDLLEDGGNGILVSAGDHAALAASLERLAAEPALRQQMGKRSREIVSTWGYEQGCEAFARLVEETVL